MDKHLVVALLRGDEAIACGKRVGASERSAPARRRHVRRRHPSSPAPNRPLAFGAIEPLHVPLAPRGFGPRRGLLGSVRGIGEAQALQQGACKAFSAPPRYRTAPLRAGRGRRGAQAAALQQALAQVRRGGPARTGPRSAPGRDHVTWKSSEGSPMSAGARSAPWSTAGRSCSSAAACGPSAGRGLAIVAFEGAAGCREPLQHPDGRPSRLIELAELGL